MGGGGDSGGGIYGYRDDYKSQHLTPGLNGDNTLLVGMQITDQPERGTQEPRLRHTGGTVGWYGAGEQEYIEVDFRDRTLHYD